MISQKNISPNTPMGSKPGQWRRRDFRAWAPLAAAVYLDGTFGGPPRTGQTDDLLLAKDANGYWTGFVDTASEGDLYRSECWDRLRTRFAGIERELNRRNGCHNHPRWIRTLVIQVFPEHRL